LLHEEHVGGDTERDALFLEGEDDAATKLAEDGVALIGADADVDGIDDFAAIDFVYTEDVGIGDGDVLEGAVAADLFGEGAEDGHDAVGVGAGVDADGERGDGEVAGLVGDSGDLAVGDDVEGAVAVAEAGETEGEVFDGALESGDGDDFADVELVLDEDEDAVEHVLEDGLGAEADADADDTGGGKQRSEVDAEDGEDVQEDDEADEAVGRGSDDGSYGADLGSALGVGDLLVGATAHAVDEEGYDALQEEGKKKDDDETRDVCADELEDVVVPVALKDLGEALFLRGQGLEEHHLKVSRFRGLC